MRLRRDSTSWSYLVPNRTSVQAGALVLVPFRGRPVLGIVWELLDQDQMATVSIERVLTTQPLLRKPQRQFLEALAHQGCTSLATTLFLALPAALRQGKISPSTSKLLEQHDGIKLSATDFAQRKQQLLLVPDDRQSARKLAAKHGSQSIILFGQTNPQTELATWLQITRGEISLVIGRDRALFAAFLNLRHIFVVEPEALAYHREQAPYLNLVDAASSLAKAWQAELQLKSGVPQAAAQVIWGDKAIGTQARAKIVLVDLRREKLLSQPLLDQLAKTTQELPAVLLYNARDHLIKTDKSPDLVRLPGVESIKKDLESQLPQVAKYCLLGTREILNQLPDRVGCTAILSADPIFKQDNFANLLDGISDLGKLLNFPAPCFVQSTKMEHPLLQALQTNDLEKYTLGVLKLRQENQLPPFATSYLCSYPEPAPSDSMESVRLKIAKILPDSWSLSHPMQTKLWKRKFSSLLLITKPGQQLPQPVYSLLAKLPRPWRISVNPWHVI